MRCPSCRTSENMWLVLQAAVTRGRPGVRPDRREARSGGRAMAGHADAVLEAPGPQDHIPLRDHLVAKVQGARLERDPFCHFYMDGIFPAPMYPALLRSLPPKELYVPLNLRRWARADGTSTRDEFHLTAGSLAGLPKAHADFWRPVVRAMTDATLRRAVFAKLAPDLAERFAIAEDRVPDM